MTRRVAGIRKIRYSLTESNLKIIFINTRLMNDKIGRLFKKL